MEKREKLSAIEPIKMFVSHVQMKLNEINSTNDAISFMIAYSCYTQQIVKVKMSITKTAALENLFQDTIKFAFVSVCVDLFILCDIYKLIDSYQFYVYAANVRFYDVISVANKCRKQNIYLFE